MNMNRFSTNSNGTTSSSSTSTPAPAGQKMLNDILENQKDMADYMNVIMKRLESVEKSIASADQERDAEAKKNEARFAATEKGLSTLVDEVSNGMKSITQKSSQSENTAFLQQLMKLLVMEDDKRATFRDELATMVAMSNSIKEKNEAASDAANFLMKFVC